MNYPRCYTIRSKETGEAVWFIVINDKKDDIAFPERLHEYLTRSYDTEVITLAEAESYDLFGVAPSGSAVEFCKWLTKELDKRINQNPHGVHGHRISDYYPVHLLIRRNKKPVGVVKINARYEDILPEPEWWDKFNKSFERYYISSSEHEENIAILRVPELSIMEVFDIVKNT